nr:hypothetical protein [Tanacetum cinerariifolium]
MRVEYVNNRKAAYNGIGVNTAGMTYYCQLKVNATTVKAKTVSEEVQLQALVDGKKVIITQSTIRRDLQLEDAKGVDCVHDAAIFEQLTLIGKTKKKETELPQTSGPTTNVVDKAVNKEMDDSLERAATTATSLDAEHDICNIFKTQSKATPNEPGSQGTSSGGGPRCQETMGDTVSQTRFERVSKISNDPLLTGVNTPRSSEDSLKLNELMKLYEGLGEDDASKQGRIADIDANEYIYLINVHNDEDMFRVNELDGDEAIAENVDVVEQAKEGKTTTTPTIITTASLRPKAKGLVIHEQEQAPTPTVSSQQPSQVKDKAKGKMVKPKPVKKLSKKDQLMMKNLHSSYKLKKKKKGLPEKKLNKLKKTELVEESSKKAEAEITQKDDGDDVTIDATPLSSKSLTIIDYKIYQEGKKSYFQIFRADARFDKVKPMDHMDSFLVHNLKTMFEHHVEDNNILYYLLVEKMYLLTNHTLHQMFNDVKLQVDYECEMAFELLRLVKK